MSRRRLVIAAALGLLVAVIGYAAWSALQVRASLASAQESARALRTALEADDPASAALLLDQLRADTSEAADRAGGPVWSVASHLPIVGDDAEAVRVVAQVLDGLADEGLPGLVEAAGQLDGRALVPRHGRVDLAAVTELRRPVGQANASFAAARGELARLDPADVIDAIADPLTELQADVDRAAGALDSAERAIDVLPTMLGADRPRTWLLVFQNNAEARATGGLPGAVALVRTEHGKARLVEHHSGGSFDSEVRPVESLRPWERTIHGTNLVSYFRDANFTPDFPRAAELWRAQWEQRFGGRIDGVIGVDPVLLSYLLEATGPVTVPGATLTSENAVDLLLHRTYVELRDPAAQDAYFADVAVRVFDTITAGGAEPRALLEQLSRAATEHRLWIHSFDAREQQRLDGTVVAGQALADQGAAPRIDVALNDSTGAKMQYFLRYDVDVVGSCRTGTTSYAATMRLSNDTPDDVRRLPAWVTGGGQYGTEVGSQLFVVDVYAPQGGSLGRVSADGVPLDYAIATTDGGRPVASVPILLAPRQRVTLTWSMGAGAAQSGATSVVVTPGVAPENESFTVPACN